MQILHTGTELDDYLSEIRKRGIKIGFVPTMGALHDGHAELVKRSLDECDYTIVSIFVNRLQFNKESDFTNYPVDIKKDIDFLDTLSCDAVFIPDNDVVFPPGYKRLDLHLGYLDEILEGPKRPGHFDGVVQVVNRFFLYIKPDKAYFGLKDYQQCMVIKALKTACFPGIGLQFCETRRTASGLAMSSRNLRLSEAGLVKAANIFKALDTVRRLSLHIEKHDALKYAHHLLEEAGIEVEYLEHAHADTLQSGKKWFRKGKNVILIAAYVEGIRLIDNICF